MAVQTSRQRGIRATMDNWGRRLESGMGGIAGFNVPLQGLQDSKKRAIFKVMQQRAFHKTVLPKNNCNQFTFGEDIQGIHVGCNLRCRLVEFFKDYFN